MDNLKIAVLGGTGKLGSALASAFSSAGHRVIIGSRSLKKDYVHASREGDIVILAIPFAAQNKIAKEIKEMVQGKVVVTTVSMSGKNGAALLQESLGSRVKVVAAFQTLAAKELSSSSEKDVLVTGDDIHACETVIDLLKTIYVRGIYSGPLANSRAIEGMTRVLLSINEYYKINNASLQIGNICKS